MPEYAVNLAIHTRWNIETYNSETPMYLLCWRQTMPRILTQPEHLGKAHSNIYYRRGDDIRVESNPLHIAHGTDPIDIHIKTMLGSTVGTWELMHCQGRQGRCRSNSHTHERSNQVQIAKGRHLRPTSNR
eukprot:3262992-Amphidinium_carterae.1